jgi:hypothetical protein
LLIMELECARNATHNVNLVLILKSIALSVPFQKETSTNFASVLRVGWSIKSTVRVLYVNSRAVVAHYLVLIAWDVRLTGNRFFLCVLVLE